jgi:hypothetical protein
VNGVVPVSPGFTPNATLDAFSPPSSSPRESSSSAEFESEPRSKIAPLADSTPATRSIRGSSRSGTVGLPLLDPSTTCLPLTTAAVSPYERSKIPPNASSSVSVST